VAAQPIHTTVGFTISLAIAVASWHLFESQVLKLLAEGMSVSGIAKQLFVSESTAKTHISKLYEKLGAANRAQALMTALRLGLLEAPDAPKF